MPSLQDLLNGISNPPAQPMGTLSQIAQGIMPPAVAPRNVATQAFEMYPALRRYNLGFINSSGKKSKHGGGSETYHPDESESPMRGRWAIEQFDPNMTAEGFLGEALHAAPHIDPLVGKMKQDFLRSMTPQQQEKMRQQYEYARQNFGEERDFDRWREMSGNDSWFRGHVTGQWPASAYTPDQLRIFQNLLQHLKTP